MNILNDKKINKKDLKSFKEWSVKESFLFGDENFFSGFISINFNKIEKKLIDFYIYNHFILEDRYYLEWPTWLKDIKSKNIKEFISELFKKRFEDDYEVFNLLENFLWELRDYRISNKKDDDLEYSILEKYWLFVKALRKTKYKNYNLWLIYINERTHIKLKGFKDAK